MIDIDRLRRKLRSDDLIDHIDIHANVKSTLAELMDRLEAVEKERDWHADRCEDAMSECARLHSKIEAMENKL